LTLYLYLIGPIYAGGNKSSTTEQFNTMYDRIPNNANILEGLARERDNILLHSTRNKYNFGWELFMICATIGYIMIAHGTSIWNFIKDIIIKFKESLSQIAAQNATQSLRVSFSRLTEESQRHVIQQLVNIMDQTTKNSA
jgi:hypothetical protein